jgi:hypothetical protein
MRSSGKVFLMALVGAAIVTLGAAIPSQAGSEFTLGHPTSNFDDGTALIPAHFSHRGRVHIADNQENVPCGGPPSLQDKTLKVTPGDVDLHIKPNKDALENINMGSVYKVKVAVSFTPAGGSETTKYKVVTLKKSGSRVAPTAGTAQTGCGGT